MLKSRIMLVTSFLLKINLISNLIYHSLNSGIQGHDRHFISIRRPNMKIMLKTNNSLFDLLLAIVLSIISMLDLQTQCT